MRSIVVLAVLALSSVVVAQPSFGIRAGLNAAWWTDTGGDLDGNARLRFVGGLTGQANVTGPVGIQVEVLYAQKGAELDGAVRYQADYLEVPFLLTGALPFAPRLRADLEVGAAVAVPLRGRFDVEPFPSPEPIDPVFLEGDLDLQTDVGVVIGARVGAGPLGLGVRYTHGLRNVIDRGACESTTAPGTSCDVVPWKNRALALTASVRVR